MFMPHKLKAHVVQNYKKQIKYNIKSYLRLICSSWCFPRANTNHSFIFSFLIQAGFIYHSKMLCLNYMLWMIHTVSVASPFSQALLAVMHIVQLTQWEAFPWSHWLYFWWRNLKPQSLLPDNYILSVANPK